MSCRMLSLSIIFLSFQIESTIPHAMGQAYLSSRYAPPNRVSTSASITQSSRSSSSLSTSTSRYSVPQSIPGTRGSSSIYRISDVDSQFSQSLTPNLSPSPISPRSSSPMTHSPSPYTDYRLGSGGHTSFDPRPESSCPCDSAAILDSKELTMEVQSGMIRKPQVAACRRLD